MAFSDDDKEKVRNAVDIVDLIGAVTTVKRSGRNHMAVCPFHQEKTPSMSIDAARGLYYCHGCHAKGDVFTFVQETQGLSFPEALEVLAAQAGVALSEDPAAAHRRGRRNRLVAVTAEAVDFYHRTLMKSEGAGHARAYLRSRGYDAAAVAEFKLGYAPDAGDTLVRELRSRGFDEGALLDAGLARRGRGGLYDYFRDRVLFPTFDVRGEPVGFGGRILGDGQPKYLNTPETPLYKKSHLLYGLDRARREIQRVGYAVVVEGYTDVIGLHRSGMTMAVATNGTALGDDHFELLRRFTDRIVLAFDADAAGGRAALRGDELSVPLDLALDLRVASMPTGTDPADMVQAGRIEEFRNAVDRSTPLLQYRIERELDGYDAREPESRARALKAVGARLARVDDDVARTEYVRFVADRLGVEMHSVEQAVGRPSRRRAPARPPRAAAVEPRRRAEEELIRALMDDAQAAVGVEIEAADFGADDTRAAFEVIVEVSKSRGAGAAVPLPGPDHPAADLLLRLTTDPRPPSPIGDVVNALRRSVLDERIERLERDLAALAPEEQTSSLILKELLLLQSERRGLEAGG
jgi:DNA primase